MNERMTKRDTDGQAMMDCEKCKADWTGKHGKPMAGCATTKRTASIETMAGDAFISVMNGYRIQKNSLNGRPLLDIRMD